MNNKTPPFAVYSPAYRAELREKVREHTDSPNLAESVKKVRLKSDCRSAVKR